MEHKDTPEAAEVDTRREVATTEAAIRVVLTTEEAAITAAAITGTIAEVIIIAAIPADGMEGYTFGPTMDRGGRTIATIRTIPGIITPGIIIPHHIITRSLTTTTLPAILYLLRPIPSLILLLLKATQGLRRPTIGENPLRCPVST